ncbi:hypothetical protein [Bradyrhizobium sp.]|uniref:hypothetical protein n=1 Tax=Bradyrhizobium sp. TaxID=376 RepID=UPI002718D12C|nr:hypothetical protein [Bradyrhizobium sp.]MDO9298844.1 hypothetical protein [Bradyrhizobium sp.]
MGNIDVGNKTPTRNPGRPMIERLARTDGTSERRIQAPNTASLKRSVNCGAMSQQCGDSGNISTPQKLVQLIGCRDPKAGSAPWVRPGARPGPAKP